MSYDQELAQRIADQLAEAGIEIDDRKMFGGLAFMVGGNMAVAVTGEGGIMVRTDPATTDDVVASSDATIMEMRGRPMTGWVRVAATCLDADDELTPWVELGIARARSLPPK